MEFANGIRKHLVRTAVNEDTSAITHLLRHSPNSHVHVDWRLPVDWLGSPGFVVMSEPEIGTKEKRSIAAKFLPPKKRLLGCLAVAVDPPPAAWVRVASVAKGNETKAVLAAMLAPTITFLRETAVSELCWLVTRDWPNVWLPDLGFTMSNKIETFVKEDSWLPKLTTNPHLEIRSTLPGDMSFLEQIEKDAFAPLWRYSAETLLIAHRQALCFDTALLDGRIVGFQLSSHDGKGAHLVRLTVSPKVQNRGVGSALLSHAIRTYNKHGLSQISLNSQVDNIGSHFLYRKFGFELIGQRMPVWVLPINNVGESH